MRGEMLNTAAVASMWAAIILSLRWCILASSRDDVWKVCSMMACSGLLQFSVGLALSANPESNDDVHGDTPMMDESIMNALQLITRNTSEV